MTAKTAISIFDQIEKLESIKKGLNDMVLIKRINFEINKLNQTLGF